jgi:hypothetical protein
MNMKLTAVAVAVMLTVVGGAAAVSSTATTGATTAADTPRDADVTATYDNGTVTVAVTNGGEPVENASVEVGDSEYTTDANGTVVAESVDAEDDVTVEVEGDALEAEQEHALENGTLTLVSEEYEDVDEDAEEEEDADEDEDAAPDAEA